MSADMSAASPSAVQNIARLRRRPDLTPYPTAIVVAAGPGFGVRKEIRLWHTPRADPAPARSA